MKKRDYSILLLVIAVLTFLIVSFEGFWYLDQYKSQFLLRVVLALQNSISVFTFAPIISASDMIDGLATLQTATGYILTYIYVIALFVAQLCTVTTLFFAFKELVVKFIFAKRALFSRKNPLVIFGYNEKVKYLLEDIYNAKKEDRYDVTLVTDDELDDAEKDDLRKKGIQLFELDVLDLDENDTFYKKISNVKKMIIFETSAIRNFSIFTTLEKAITQFKNTPKCYLYCEDAGIREIIEEYHKCGKYEKRMDISIFNLAEIKVREIFKDDEKSHSLVVVPADLTKESYLENPSQFDVHLLIVGFGSVGEQVLLHALNQGVAHSQSRIWVDIVDNDAFTKDDFFMKRFHPEYMEGSKNDEQTIVYTISDKKADGELLIRFHNIDIRSKQFPKLLDTLIKDASKVDAKFQFTRVVACFKEMDNLARCIVEMKKHLNKHNNSCIEMTVCAEMGDTLIEYFDTIVNDKINVRAAGADKAALKVENIIDDTKENKAKKYSYTYNQLYDLLSKGALIEIQRPTEKQLNENWLEQDYENKISNYMLSEHDVMKKAIIEKTYPEQNYDELLLQKGGVLFDENGKFIESRFKDEINKKENGFVKEMLMMEHRRWNYFSALNGWSYIKQESSKKNPATKEHPCLSNFGILMNDHLDKVVYDLIPVLMRKYVEENTDGKL